MVRIGALLVFAIMLAIMLAIVLLVACAPSRARPVPESAPVARRAETGEPSVEWHLVLGEDLALRERICWRGFEAKSVVPEMIEGLRFARGVREDGSPLTATASGFSVSGSSGCVRLAIDLAAAARDLDNEASLVRAGGAVYGSLDVWLFRPSPWPSGLQGRLFVETAPGLAVSLPLARDAEGAFVVPYSTWKMMARAALGRITVDTIEVAGATMTIATLPDAARSATPAGIRRALAGAASAVATLDGRMPAEQIQVLVRDAGRGGDPIAFGMAMRGGGPGVMLLVSSSATDTSLYGEWIAVHELSHFWIPSLDAETSWLSEGFSSYTQCILRSRVGMYSEADAWDELVSGFERGRAQAQKTLLADARPPRFQQIYWGGAAILFKLDVELRKSGTSLDAVVSAARRAAPGDDDEPSVDEVLARFSRVAGRDLRPMVAGWTRAPFPDTSNELRELGIVRRGGGIVLDDGAPRAKLRAAIAGRR